MICERRPINNQGCRKQFLENRSKIGEVLWGGRVWGHSQWCEGLLLTLCTRVNSRGAWEIICTDWTRIATCKASNYFTSHVISLTEKNSFVCLSWNFSPYLPFSNGSFGGHPSHLAPIQNFLWRSDVNNCWKTMVEPIGCDYNEVEMSPNQEGGRGWKLYQEIFILWVFLFANATQLWVEEKKPILELKGYFSQNSG